MKKKRVTGSEQRAAAQQKNWERYNANKATQERALRRQATRMRRAAKALDLAATYKIDGAHLSTVRLVNEAVKDAKNTLIYLKSRHWDSA